jgi:hypothetical protein
MIKCAPKISALSIYKKYQASYWELSISPPSWHEFTPIIEARVARCGVKYHANYISI